MDIWNDVVSFIEPYWTSLMEFMNQTSTHNLWWFIGIVIVSFMIGRMSKRTVIRYQDKIQYQEKVVYRDKEIKVCSQACIMEIAQKLYNNIEVDQVDFETQQEQNEGMEVRRKIMEYCMEEAKKLHGGSIPLTPS